MERESFRERRLVTAIHTLLRPPYFVDRRNHPEVFHTLSEEAGEVDKRLRQVGYSLLPLKGEGAPYAYLALALGKREREFLVKELVPLVVFAQLALASRICHYDEIYPEYRFSWQGFVGELRAVWETRSLRALERYERHVRKRLTASERRHRLLELGEEGVMEILRKDLEDRGYLRPIEGADGNVYALTGKVGLLHTPLARGLLLGEEP